MDRITDYDSLVAGVRELVDLDVGDSVDAFIQLTEQDMGRQIDSLWQENTETLAVLQAGLFFDDARRGILRVSINGHPLEKLHIDAAREAYVNWTPDRPRAYSVTGGTTAAPYQQHVLFWPIPPDDSSYQAEISFKVLIPPLTSQAPTNWVMSIAPDAYLYGAARHAVVYNGDETSLTAYERMYAIGVSGVANEIKRYHSVQKSVSPPGAGGYEHWLP